VIESLIKCGAFDSLGLKRAQMMAILSRAMDTASATQKEKALGQMLLFGNQPTEQRVPDMKEWPESQILTFEKEILGFYITGHPLAKYEKMLREYSTANSNVLKKLEDGARVRFGGMINKVKSTITKRTGEKMAIMMMEDLEGKVEILVFPAAYKKVSKYVRANFGVFVEGRLSMREDRPKIIVENIVPIEEARLRFTQAISVDLISLGMESDILEGLKKVLKKHRGDTPVYLNVSTKRNGSYRILVDRELFVMPTNEMVSELEDFVGRDHVSFEKTNYCN